jgi:hypothetical protein
MRISSTIATHYFLRLVFLVALPCLAFTAWGAYDLWWKYPYQAWTNELHDAHQELLRKQEERAISAVRPADQRLVDIAARAVSFNSATPTEAQLLEVFNGLAQRYERTAKPSAFDDIVCWIFISCILAVPWALWRIYYLRSHTFALDDDGLHLPDGSLWKHDDIASIDMSRWMEKSIAWIVHRDGRRVKMDAYLYKNLEHIIGAIAHRFDPAAWNVDGTRVKGEGGSVAAKSAEHSAEAAIEGRQGATEAV